MKDKENQVEEMAKAICSHCLEMTEEKVCPYAKTEDEVCNEACFTERLHEAEKVYNAGYRKLPKDSVLLSNEELNEIINQTKETEKNYYKRVVIPQERKETAEKILNTIYDKLNTFEAVYEIDYESYVDDVLWEISKQFGVEIKE